MSKRIVFIVQGEGRGHFTQAIAAYEILSKGGYHVAAVLVGSSRRREIPEFVRERINAPFFNFESPNFVTDSKNRSIHLGRSVFNTLFHIRKYLKSIRFIQQNVHKAEADTVINFYEPLAGICKKYYQWKIPMLSIAHQFLYLHPEFEFPSGANTVQKNVIRFYTKFVSIGADAIMALSFYPFKTQQYRNISVTPPLLRSCIKEQEIYTGNHFLIYLVNAGYMEAVITWHKKHPDIIIHCFTDSKMVKGSWQYDDRLTFHSLHDQRFLKYMASARGIMTTAGFETVCEAMYLNKPVLMVPVEGHFEQWCNARDGAKAGAGIYAENFNIDPLIALTDHSIETSNHFKDWVDKTQDILRSFVQNEPINHKTQTPPLILNISKVAENEISTQSIV